MRKDTLEFIKKWEGVSLKPYSDVAGYATIGYGHLIKNSDAAKFKDGITKQQAEQLLIKDLEEAVEALERTCRVNITPDQETACISFIFNLGGSRWKSSTLLRKLNRGDIYGAANEFPRWKWAGGRIVQGLLNRRLEEKELFLRNLGDHIIEC